MWGCAERPKPEEGSIAHWTRGQSIISVLLMGCDLEGGSPWNLEKVLPGKLVHKLTSGWWEGVRRGASQVGRRANHDLVKHSSPDQRKFSLAGARSQKGLPIGDGDVAVQREWSEVQSSARHPSLPQDSAGGDHPGRPRTMPAFLRWTSSYSQQGRGAPGTCLPVSSRPSQPPHEAGTVEAPIIQTHQPRPRS